MNPLFFGAVYLVPFLVVSGYILGGWAHALTPIAVFVLVPLTDVLLGTYTDNPNPEMEKKIKNALGYKLMTWVAVPIQVGLMFWGAWIISTKGLPFGQAAALTINIGISGAVLAINIAHEMVHRGVKFERFGGLMLLWSVTYIHWWLEHVAGHHRHVATPGDPATARYGQSFYAFWPKTVFGSFKSAWNIEKGMLARRKLPLWSFKNRIVRYVAASVLLILGITVFFGFKAFIYFIFQSVVAFSLLEVVNYIEHYGLARRKLESGEYEKVTPSHSWNSSEMFTNLFLFNLQRHSDHHANPNRRYQILRHYDHSPQLPTGYAGLVLVALVPPLWFWLMNKRVPEQMREIAKEWA